MPHWTEISEKRSAVAEIKFLVPLSGADAIRDWARARLSRDPYGEGPCGDTYRTTSLYLDTDAFDVLNRRGSYGRSKYRVRRYGESDLVFLERKLKKADQVSKRRSTVALDALPRLESTEPERHWAGSWFHRRVLARELHVVCEVSYRRMALLGAEIRLTLDDELRVRPASRFAFSERTESEAFLEEYAVLELKYRSELPAVFRELIDSFGLAPVPVSKYRCAMAESEVHVQHA